MSLNQTIRSALGGLGLPVVPNHYTGDKPVYITFNYNLLPYHYTDDEPGFWQALIQVHLFAPIGTNVLSTREAIPGLLVAAGLDLPMVEDAGDEDGQHYVFETETLEPLEVQENGAP